MLIQTSRFGTLEVDGDKLITFKDGLLGFPEHRRFALLQTSPDPVFYWMQSADDPAIAFIVCDPTSFVPGYQVPVRADDLAALEMKDLFDSQALVIVNKVDGDLTANLLGPLVVAVRSRLAKQLVLSDRRFGTRHRLMRAEPRRAVARTA
jgi:flagellar assembly factor FliW